MKNHALAGFSLFELAICLVVMGLMLGAAMPSVLRYRQQAALRETKERQEVIVQAVATYTLMHGELPGPADPSKDGTSELCRTADKAVGIVPYKTLGLTQVQAKDGYGRYMTYAVPVIIPDLPQTAYNHKLCAIQPSAGIILKEKDTTRYTGDNKNEDIVALVLISHGPSGQGAFSGKGRDRIAGQTMGPAELANASSDLIFQDNPYASEDSQHPFRHTVKWVTMQNLLGVYGRSPCVRLKNDTPPPSQNMPNSDPTPFDPFRTRLNIPDKK